MNSISHDDLERRESTMDENLDSGKQELNKESRERTEEHTKVENEREDGNSKEVNRKLPDVTKTVVPDGGWGWLVAFGAFIITMLLSSLGPCFGILFSRYLLELGASSVLTAWIFNVQLFIWHLMGPLVRPLSAEFGWRPVGLLGVLLCSMSIILSAFSPSASFLFFSFSLLSGIGGGLVVSMCYIIVPQYFNHRRGKANAIMMTGLCMGQILGAPFVRYLQDQEGFLGSTLIFGAIMLHGCVGVAFFHPVDWHMQKVKVDGDQPFLEDGRSPLISQKRNKKENGNSTQNDVAEKVSLEQPHRSPVYDKAPLDIADINEPGKKDKHSLESLPSEEVTLQIKDVMSPNAAGGILIDAQSKKNTSMPLKILRIVGRVAHSTASDLKILKNRRALIIAFGNMLCMNAYFNFIMMVPFAMQSANFTLQDSAWCITVMGIFNLLSRILLSVISDWPSFSMRLCCMAGYAVLAGVMFVFPLLKEVSWLVLLMGVFGCGLAATISLLHLVMIQYMGVENLAPIFGSTCLLIGVGFPTFGPFIGFIRDWSGSYKLSMWILSAMMVLAFVLWLFMPAAVSSDIKRMNKRSLRL
ncbi:monocarboxylate transporter 14-like [Palaemon carinicauda]|uniref:monocarboxylate transporter 14-like n=1 Tax=Palaemon carinicauda TaxID=392227 RepID=UPI0035B63EA8